MENNIKFFWIFWLIALFCALLSFVDIEYTLPMALVIIMMLFPAYELFNKNTGVSRTKVRFNAQ